MAKIWRFFSEEQQETATKNKVWLVNIITDEKVLCKADYGKMRISESQAEAAVYEIGRALGMSYAKTERINIVDIDWLGFDLKKEDIPNPTGIISYNFKTDGNIIYKPASKIFGEKDLKTLLIEYPNLKTDLINMTFLDCLVNNSDRHGENWEVMCDPKTKRVLGIAELFDHAITLQNGNNDNFSRIYWELPPKKYRDKLQTHYEVFRGLCENYREEIKKLLEKTVCLAKAGKLDNFVLPRLKEMAKIMNT